MSTYYLSRGDETMIFHRTHVTDHGRKPVTDSWRPVVVIDPDDRGQVDRFLAAADRALSHPRDERLHIFAAALREFANPTPPKPDEPTGLGAVVEDEDGQRWVRAGRSHDGRLEDNWRGVDGGVCGGWWSKYADIKVARVLSEGVAS